MLNVDVDIQISLHFQKGFSFISFLLFVSCFHFVVHFFFPFSIWMKERLNCGGNFIMHSTIQYNILKNCRKKKSLCLRKCRKCDKGETLPPKIFAIVESYKIDSKITLNILFVTNRWFKLEPVKMNCVTKLHDK